MSARHVAVERSGDLIHWVRARARRSGLSPDAWGSVRRDPRRSYEAQVAELLTSRKLRGCRLDLALPSPGLVHRREELPPMGRADALAVVRRRGPSLLEEIPEAACLAHSRRPGSGAGPLWLSAAPERVVTEALRPWDRLGVAVNRIDGAQLALGRLVQLFEPTRGDALVALVDLRADEGHCVVADARGWVFGRDLSLGFLDATAESDVAIADAAPWPKPADRAEPVATELRRTFQYVSNQLRLGDVGRVLLTGDDPRLGSLARELTARLDLPVEPIVEAIPAPLGSLAARAPVALGLALAPDAGSGGLLATPRLVERDRARARRQLQRSLAAVLVAGLLLGGVGLLHSRGLRAEVDRLEALWQAEQARRSHVQFATEARRRDTAVAALADEIDRPAPSWTALLEMLARLVPADAAVERVRVARSDADESWIATLAVQATGATVSEAARAVASFSERLDASPLLAVEEVSSEGTGGAPGAEAAAVRLRFRIRGRLAPMTPAREGREDRA